MAAEVSQRAPHRVVGVVVVVVAAAAVVKQSTPNRPSGVATTKNT